VTCSDAPHGRCLGCGEDVAPDWVACPKCGAPLPRGQTIPATGDAGDRSAVPRKRAAKHGSGTVQ
jgi:hypothetical protein